MPINPMNDGEEVLLVRQRHEAKRMGLHWDYRFVKGEHAYSYATKKEMPEPGKAIVLFEQPVHDRAYAMSERIEIPDGNYGAGVTTLDWARKAKIESHEDGTMVIHANGERFLLKKLDDSKYGKKAWLFKNMSEPMKKEAGSLLKYIKAKKPTYSQSNHFLHQHYVDIGDDYLSTPIADRLRSFNQVKTYPSRAWVAGSHKFPETPSKDAMRNYVHKAMNPSRKPIVERQQQLQSMLKKADMSNKYLEKIAKISIDPANKGKLHKAMGKPEGEKLSTADEEATKAKAKAEGNTKLEREAQFAINAKKWHKK